MSDENRIDEQQTGAAAEKKVTLAELAKRKLAQNKAGQRGKGNTQPGHQPTGMKKMQSQMTKKVNNQKRRTGV